MKKVSTVLFGLLLALSFVSLAPARAQESSQNTQAKHKLHVPQTGHKRHGHEHRRPHGAKSSYSKAGKSAGHGGKSFGKDVGHGKPIKGGKELGKGVGGAGKDTGKGTAKVGKKVGKGTKKVFK